MVFETKNAKFVSFQKMVDKKNLFETKNASHFLSGLHFLFQKGFFCQPFFEKIQGFGFPELFIKQKNINIQKKYWSISYFIIKTAIWLSR